MTIQEKIKELQSKLTGDLFKDGETQQAIYELKKELLFQSEDYNTIEEIDDDLDEGCLYCGS